MSYPSLTALPPPSFGSGAGAPPPASAPLVRGVSGVMELDPTIDLSRVRGQSAHGRCLLAFSFPSLPNPCSWPHMLGLPVIMCLMCHIHSNSRISHVAVADAHGLRFSQAVRRQRGTVRRSAGEPISCTCFYNLNVIAFMPSFPQTLEALEESFIRGTSKPDEVLRVALLLACAESCLYMFVFGSTRSGAKHCWARSKHRKARCEATVF